MRDLFIIFAGELSDYHVRKKRVIDKTPGGNKPVMFHHVPYIVRITTNGNSECAGNILSPVIILTAAHCVEERTMTYSVLSSSRYLDRGINHNITRIIIHPDYRPNGFSHDLALLVIFPPIDIHHLPNQKIEIHEGPVPKNTLGTVSGWGCNSVNL